MRGTFNKIAAIGAAMAGAVMASTELVRNERIDSTRLDYCRGKNVPDGQPYRGTAGMARGTKVRGTRNVQRAALKRRNKIRARKACR